MDEINRREFLEFMGRTALGIGGAGLLPGCVTGSRRLPEPPADGLPFEPIKPTRQDGLVLAKGFTPQVVVSWGDSINSRGERFGFNNDFTAYLPFTPGDPSRGWLWVNHEFHDPYYTRGWRPGHINTPDEALKDRREVGGSLLEIQQTGGSWKVNKESRFNRRYDGFTAIPFAWDHPIAGARSATGTIANCAGGVTPWGTFLSCEENFQNFVGQVEFEGTKRKWVPSPEPYLAYGQTLDLPPEHYGWVVEIDPNSGTAKKLVAMGRFCHESATTKLARDGRTVVYLGDDTDQEHLYKFIASRPGSLESGDLYVADIKAGRWQLLNRDKDDRLKKAFKNQTELLIRTREAAKLLGATPLNRPEDIEIDPLTGAVYLALTKGQKVGDLFGSILKLEERNADPLSLEFTSSTFLTGGPTSGFSNPDNLVFDRAGNLWMTNDMADTAMYKDPFASFGNNGLFFIPLRGANAGRVFQVGSAPCGAELTGPSFSADGKTLFLSVQHPGEACFMRPEFASHWPDGGEAVPKPSVVAISGPALLEIVSV